MPDAFVVTVLPLGDEIDPPPPVTAKTTATPATGLLPASRTNTDGAVDTALPAVAVCALPALTAICVAVLEVPVAVNVTGLPLNPDTAAVSVFVPALAPTAHAVNAATPEPFVFTVSGPATRPEPLSIVPAPPVTVKVTVVLVTGLPFTSRTRTAGAMATEVLDRKRVV